MDGSDSGFLLVKDTITSIRILTHYNQLVGSQCMRLWCRHSHFPCTTRWIYCICILNSLQVNITMLIFWSKEIHQYLYGHKFILTTDHKPCWPFQDQRKVSVPLISSSKKATTLDNPTLCLQPWDIVFKSTHEHGNADGLSCLPLWTEKAEVLLTESSIFIISQI